MDAHLHIVLFLVELFGLLAVKGDLDAPFRQLVDDEALDHRGRDEEQGHVASTFHDEADVPPERKRDFLFQPGKEEHLD